MLASVCVVFWLQASGFFWGVHSQQNKRFVVLPPMIAHTCFDFSLRDKVKTIIRHFIRSLKGGGISWVPILDIDLYICTCNFAYP